MFRSFSTTPLDLSQKIILATMIPFIIVIASISLLTIQNNSQNERNLTLGRIESFVQLLESGQLSFNTIESKDQIEKLLHERIVFTRLLNRNFGIIYSTEENEVESSELQTEYLNQALQGNIITYVIKEPSPHLNYITPIAVNGNIIGILHTDILLNESNSRVLNYTFFIISISIIGLIVAYVSVFTLIKYVVVSRIQELEISSKRIAQGDVDSPIKPSIIQSGDEIGKLGSTFETMRKTVKQTQVKLEEYNKRLEKEVAERTEELAKKNKELERFNDIVIGRELKMVELKNKLKDLENK